MQEVIEESPSEEQTPHRWLLPTIGTAIWLVVVSWAAWTTIHGAEVAPVDPYRMGFFKADMKAYPVGILAFLISLLAPIAFPRWWKLPALILIAGSTWFAAGWALSTAGDIESDRTPPCWGIHSVDPGSGASCDNGLPDGISQEGIERWLKGTKQNPR